MVKSARTSSSKRKTCSVCAGRALESSTWHIVSVRIALIARHRRTTTITQSPTRKSHPSVSGYVFAHSRPMQLSLLVSVAFCRVGCGAQRSLRSDQRWPRSLHDHAGSDSQVVTWFLPVHPSAPEHEQHLVDECLPGPEGSLGAIWSHSRHRRSRDRSRRRSRNCEFVVRSLPSRRKASIITALYSS